MRATRLIVIAILAAAVLPASESTAGTPHGAGPNVQLSPAIGFPSTRFVVRFKTADRTGRYGTRARSYLLNASGPTAAGCTGSLSIGLPESAKGTHVRVVLAPVRPSRFWCTGTYRGKIEEIERAVCPKGELCPTYVLLRGILGWFSFRVQQPAIDTTPPDFGGILGAMACTPGPQLPGQTTPYHLSWRPATDDVTPSAGIVYDVYVASTSGGEDFSRPTWTTPPGRLIAHLADGTAVYSTPGLPSHGTPYFVVRARDQAGNEDQNKVQVRGVDPCY